MLQNKCICSSFLEWQFMYWGIFAIFTCKVYGNNIFFGLIVSFSWYLSEFNILMFLFRLLRSQTSSFGNTVAALPACVFVCGPRTLTGRQGLIRILCHLIWLVEAITARLIQRLEKCFRWQCMHTASTAKHKRSHALAASSARMSSVSSQWFGVNEQRWASVIIPRCLTSTLTRRTC